MLKSLFKNRGASKYLDLDWHIRSYEVLFLFYLGICLYLLSLTPLPWSTKFLRHSVYLTSRALAALYLLALGLTFLKLLRQKSGRKWSELFTKENILKTSYPYCTLNFLFLTIRRSAAVFGTIYLFLHLKHVILFINRDNYDLFYWNLDRWVHFGVQPNIWAMIKFGVNRDVAVLTDFLYIKYFQYKFIVCLFFMLEIKGRALSEKFFAAYVACWALGGLGYLIAPADGPCYAVLGHYNIEGNKREHFFEYPVTRDIPNEYAANYVYSKILTAKTLQRKLWDERWGFLQGVRAPGIFYGIAAMPSLHVAAVVMLAIFVTRASAIAGVIAWMFAAMTFFGSVLLQWHYAIDGYAGVILALIACSIPRLFSKRFFEEKV